MVARLHREFDVELRHERIWRLIDMVNRVKEDFPDVPFAEPDNNRWFEPDGGILSIIDRKDQSHVILISEVKNQGTNVERVAAGLKRQPMGNAIERLGRYMIAFRTAMLSEEIMPFVCFGDGWILRTEVTSSTASLRWLCSGHSTRSAFITKARTAVSTAAAFSFARRNGHRGRWQG